MAMVAHVRAHHCGYYGPTYICGYYGIPIHFGPTYKFPGGYIFPCTMYIRAPTAPESGAVDADRFL